MMLKSIQSTFLTGCTPRCLLRCHLKPACLSHILCLNISMGQPNLSVKRIKTHYEKLGLSRSASATEIKAAYIQLSKTCHPDRNMGDKSLHAKFVEINEAYSVLSHPEKRRVYDNSLLESHRVYDTSRNNDFHRYREQQSSQTSHHASSHWQESSFRQNFGHNFWENSENREENVNEELLNLVNVVVFVCFCFGIFAIWKLSVPVTRVSDYSEFLDEKKNVNEEFKQSNPNAANIPPYPHGDSVKVKGEDVELKDLKKGT